MSQSLRIRYKKTKSPHILTSVRHFKSNSNGGYYRVDLHTDTMTYRIVNVNKQMLVRSSEIDKALPCTHIVTLRRQAKKALKDLGVIFDMEIRVYSEKHTDKSEPDNEVQT